MSKKKIEEDKFRVISLKGFKTTLRPVNVEHDLPYVMKWINDETINKFVQAISPLSEYQERQYLEGLGKNPNNIVYAIDTLEGRFIGMMGLHNIDWVSGMATTGALIGDKEYWGKGCGYDAQMLLLHHAFHRLNLRRINSETVEFNKRSTRCLLKCGYKPEGIRKNYKFWNGKYWDQNLFRLFRGEFEPLWKEYAKNLPQEEEEVRK